MTIIDQ